MDKSNHGKNRSKKHHYLPRYYLKGFTDCDDKFFVYDKKQKIILPKPISPLVFFAENDLNTITLPNGKTSDFLENLYTNVENQVWGPFDRIRHSKLNDPINILDKMSVFLFLLFLHWRLPSNIKYAENLSRNLFLENSNLNYVTLKNKNGKNVSEEIKFLLKNSPAFKKATKLLAPFAPFYENNWVDKLENWRFLYTEDKCDWYLVGDNPIITKNINDHDPTHCLDEFIFPISGKLILINTAKPISENLNREFIIQFGFSIIKRAERFIACPRKDLLEAFVADYTKHAGTQSEMDTINQLFALLEKK
ncbi:MAG: DUF4238 domain-containing protein [Candidatus Magasanikbacteria bacterium]